MTPGNDQEIVIWTLTDAPAGSAFDGQEPLDFVQGENNGEFRILDGQQGAILTMHQRANGDAPAIYGTWSFEVKTYNAGTGCESEIISGFSATSEEVLDEACPWAGPDQIICPGECVMLGCSVADIPEDYCFAWQPSEAVGEGYSAFSLQTMVCPNETTTYTLFISNEEGEIIHEETVTIEVISVAELAILSSNPMLCQGTSVILTSSYAEAGFSYSWGPVDLVPLGAAGPNIVVGLPGTYELTVTEPQAGCSQSAAIEVLAEGDPAEGGAIKDFFRSKGFIEIPIEITGTLEGRPAPGDVLNSAELVTNNYAFVRDEAGKLFNIIDEDVDLPGYLEQTLSNSDFEPLQRMAFITANELTCLSNDGMTTLLEEVEGEYNQQSLGYWVHLWEDPDDGQDCLFAQSISPNGAPFIPRSPQEASDIVAFFDEVKAGNNHYDFASADLHLSSVLFDQLEGLYDVPMYEEGSYLQNPSDASSFSLAENCDGILLSEEGTFCLNAAGRPVQLPAGSLMGFSLPNERANSLHDIRALTRFIVPEGDTYLSYGNPTSQMHTGFKNPRRPKNPDGTNRYYPFPAVTTTNCLPTTFGESQLNNGCRMVTLNSFAYTTALGSSYPVGSRSGPYVADFAASGSFCEDGAGSPIVTGPTVVTQGCLPTLNFIEFTDAVESARFNPYGEGGILFKIDTNGDEFITVEEIFYGRFEGLDPTADYTFYLWDCEQGGWVRIDAPAPDVVETMSVYEAMYRTVIELFTGQLGWPEVSGNALHTALDIAGMLPVIGTAADIANGFWYLAEGDFGNASLALIAAVPFIGDATQLTLQGGRYLWNIGENTFVYARQVLRFCSLAGRPDYPTGIFDSQNLIVSTRLNRLYNTITCDFDRAYLVQRILDSAHDLGLSAEQTKGVISFIDQSKVIAQQELSAARTIGRLFNTYPDLLKTWHVVDQELSFAQKERFFQGLAKLDNPSLIQAFADAPEKVRGWKLIDEIYVPNGSNATNISNNMRRFDWLLISQATDLLDNSTFMSRIAPNGADVNAQREALKKIIERNRRAGCEVCSPATVAHLDMIHDYLEQVRQFTEVAHTVEGFEDVMRSMRTGHIYEVDANAHLMRMIFGNVDGSPGLLNRLEPPLGNVVPSNSLDEVTEVIDEIDVDDPLLTNLNRGDYQRELPLAANFSLNELKSYGVGSINKIPTNTKFKNQLRAYFGNLNVQLISNMNYFFDARKLVGQGRPFANAEEATTYIRQKFQSVFLQDGQPANGIFEEIWENMRLREALFDPDDFPTEASAIPEFISKANDFGSDLYSFIKVQ